MNEGWVGISVAALWLALALGAGARADSLAPAIGQIAKQLDEHPLVMIGELHRWEQLHAFMRKMLRNPPFVCRADDGVVEFGNSRLQGLADSYAAGGDGPDRPGGSAAGLVEDQDRERLCAVG